MQSWWFPSAFFLFLLSDIKSAEVVFEVKFTPDILIQLCHMTVGV